MTEQYKSLTDKGFECREFTVTAGDRKVAAMIVSPAAADLAPDPVLLLTIGGQNTHLLPPNDQPASFFLERGHRAVSFEIPFELEAEDVLKADINPEGRIYNAGIEIMRDEFLRGKGPFVTFIEDAKAVLDVCEKNNWATPGRIVVTGISRFAYFAFRLMASDSRLNIGGGFAPVTDWRNLSEFAECCEREDVAALRLSLFVDKLAGKKICMAIGNHDRRVGTPSCCEFFLDLYRENCNRGYDEGLVDFFCTPDPHHTCSEQWYERCMEILLTAAVSDNTFNM
jgi:hypothetical protein